MVMKIRGLDFAREPLIRFRFMDVLGMRGEKRIDQRTFPGAMRSADGYSHDCLSVGQLHTKVGRRPAICAKTATNVSFHVRRAAELVPLLEGANRHRRNSRRSRRRDVPESSRAYRYLHRSRIPAPTAAGPEGTRRTPDISLRPETTCCVPRAHG